jgi:hypothetical protein
MEVNPQTKSKMPFTNGYYAALREGAAARVVGGMIYDALLARCAVNSEADIIYTWNQKHFQQSSPEIAKRLRTPQ